MRREADEDTASHDEHVPSVNRRGWFDVAQRPIARERRRHRLWFSVWCDTCAGTCYDRDFVEDDGGILDEHRVGHQPSRHALDAASERTQGLLGTDRVELVRCARRWAREPDA